VDWRHAIGTGSFILQDFTSGVSATLVKNKNYWGHDERYPRNKLPYLDTVKYLVITDEIAATEAMRAGKIDIIDGLSYRQVQAMQKTNPEIISIFTPLPPTFFDGPAD